jgi:hypothetical protein
MFVLAEEGSEDKPQEEQRADEPAPEPEPQKEPEPIFESEPPQEPEIPDEPKDNFEEPREDFPGPQCQLYCGGKCEWLDSESCSCQVDQGCLDSNKYECESGYHEEDGRCVPDYKEKQEDNICERIECQPGCFCENFKGCICPSEGIGGDPCENVECPDKHFCKNGDCVRYEDDTPSNDCSSIYCGEGTYCENGRCIQEKEDSGSGGQCPSINGFRILRGNCLSAYGCDVEFKSVEECEKTIGHLGDYEENDLDSQRRRAYEDAQRRKQRERTFEDGDGLHDQLREEEGRFKEQEKREMAEGRSSEVDDFIQQMEDKLWEVEDLQEYEEVDASEAINYIKGKIKEAKSIKSKVGTVDEKVIDRDLQRLRGHRTWREMEKLTKAVYESSERQRVSEEAEFFIEDKEYRLLEDIKWQLKDLKDFGVDASDVETLVKEVEDGINEVKELIKSEKINWRTFERSRRKADRAEQKIWRTLEQSREVFEVKRMLEEIDFHMSDAEYAIQEFKAYGIDVSEAEETIDLVEDVVKKVKQLMKDGKGREAMRLFRGMEFVGRKMESLFRDYDKELRQKGGGNVKETKIKDILEEAFERIPIAEEKINDFREDGVDTRDAENVLGKIKGIVFKAKELYKDDDSEEAFFVIREAFPYASKLERLFKEYGDKQSKEEGSEDEDYDDDTSSEAGKFSSLKNKINKIKKEIKQILNNVDKNLPSAKEKVNFYKENDIDTANAIQLLREIEEIVEKARNKFNSNDFIGALNTIEEAYPLADRLESEFDKFDKRRSKGDLRTEVEGIINEATANIPRVKSSIEGYKSKGIDVSKAERLLEKIESIVNKANEKVNDKEYNDALEVIRNAFPLGKDVEVLFEEYNSGLDTNDLKQQLDEIYQDAEENIPQVEAILEKVETEGINTEEARKAFTEIKELLSSSRSLYSTQKYGQAIHVVKKAEELSVNLGHLLEEHFSLIEHGEEITSIEEPQKQTLIERVLSTGDKRDEFDIYDEDFEKEYKEIEDELKEVVDKAREETSSPDKEDFRNVDDLERLTKERFSDDEFDDRRRDDRRADDRRFGKDDNRERNDFDDRGRRDHEFDDRGRNDEDRGPDVKSCEECYEFCNGAKFCETKCDEGICGGRPPKDERRSDDREFGRDEFDDRGRNFENSREGGII